MSKLVRESLDRPEPPGGSSSIKVPSCGVALGIISSLDVPGLSGLRMDKKDLSFEAPEMSSLDAPAVWGAVLFTRPGRRLFNSARSENRPLAIRLPFPWTEFSRGAGSDQPIHPIFSSSRPGHPHSVPRPTDLTGPETGSADDASVAFVIIGEGQFAEIPPPDAVAIEEEGGSC